MKHVTDATRSAHPEVPWREAAGARDRLYFDVDLDGVWSIVTKDLSDLGASLERLLGSEP